MAGQAAAAAFADKLMHPLALWQHKAARPTCVLQTTWPAMCLCHPPTHPSPPSCLPAILQVLGPSRLCDDRAAAAARRSAAEPQPAAVAGGRQPGMKAQQRQQLMDSCHPRIKFASS